MQEVVLHKIGILWWFSNSQAKKTTSWVVKNSFVWNDKLLFCTKAKLKAIGTKRERLNVLKMFPNSIGHWDRHATDNTISDRFWWPSMKREIFEDVSAYELCQRMRSTSKYVIKLNCPLNVLLDAVPIDFAGMFPTRCKGTQDFFQFVRNT